MVYFNQNSTLLFNPNLNLWSDFESDNNQRPNLLESKLLTILSVAPNCLSLLLKLVDPEMKLQDSEP